MNLTIGIRSSQKKPLTHIYYYYYTTHYIRTKWYETVCTHMCALQQWHTNLAQRKTYA